MISADILRGRFRESFERAQPITPDVVLEYTVRLPHAYHTFQRGHRLMVQIHSSWFPLYDRNPQTFVDSIFDAPPHSYRPATHAIHTGGGHASRVHVSVPG
jgi:predicted acyl esterase